MNPNGAVAAISTGTLSSFSQRSSCTLLMTDSMQFHMQMRIEVRRPLRAGRRAALWKVG
jgi:hypothetical protein